MLKETTDRQVETLVSQNSKNCILSKKAVIYPSYSDLVKLTYSTCTTFTLLHKL